jgi:GNAT superfamily N-acetyltransferase
MTTSLSSRFAALPGAPIEASLQLTTGTAGDYRALARFHYRSHRPATFTRVLALRVDRPTVAGRYLRRAAASQVVGVLVESLPPIACRLRDVALGDRYRAIACPRQRLLAVNRELRCISRVVVHPQWRGLGLSVRLVRAALESATTVLTEALAAMGHVHPFFERAGMRAYRRPPHAFDARLGDVLRSCGFDLLQLTDAETLARAIAASPRAALLDAELRRWHRALHRGGTYPGHIEALTLARRKLLAQPVYLLAGGGQ